MDSEHGFVDLGFAKIDTDRKKRCGFPEVIFCAGKTPQQVKGIFQELAAMEEIVLATRATEEHYQAVRESVPEAQYLSEARIIVKGEPPRNPVGLVAVITGGSSDIPVAEEAAVVASYLGSKVVRYYDAGVAGIHRLLAFRDQMAQANAIIVVAGMDGALPSVVGGLVDKPIVAVPTSVGYGANFQGLAPLLTMLNSCSAGVSVVNIDNGFGAGYYAHLINRGASVNE
ncbi:MAG: nickel pincer cofactor biosynthesis protein LarB [Firmicutes bacterium]|nr:nickel pincer cofactor biosynthesis protein LarB [Bacillota bacterium]